MTVPLFTSIPPAMSRLDPNGVEVGAEYQLACIRSWGLAGFDPISVNSAKEPYNHAVPTMRVERDASAVSGRPHVLFSDMLATASNAADGRPFALMNADLMVPPSSDLASKVAALNPGEMIFSRRTDIERMDQVAGETYHRGFDFFAAHADDVRHLHDVGMVFGAPWWDHLFLLTMFMQGCKLRQIEPAVLHLKHDERWEQPVWEGLARQFVSVMKAGTTDAQYRAILDRAIKGPGRRFLIWKRMRNHTISETTRMFRRVSDANLKFIDEISA